MEGVFGVTKMINKFNAFISYKHADLDNKIAAMIVKELEHYHIPAKIRRSTGYKKIERIFRDKDELPITNDLNDTITMALANSDYLIVICSTNTKKSTWVEKEIETFLQTHDINHVLTVLADGEPYDVIPKILLTRKHQVQDENGVYHTVEIPMEPLSCDFRMSLRKAKAIEIPRLVAVLIGCSYDELMNRHRQYKMRRLSAAFAGVVALATGFCLYMYHSNTLIQQNYVEAMRNQSRYLANESSKQLDDENRIEAMELALEALPKDETDQRPIIPQAIRSITDASLAYVTLQGSNVNAVWNYRMPNQVDKFELSPDGATLAAIDYNGVVQAWDTASHEMILYADGTEDSTLGFEFIGNDKILVTRIFSLELYDLKSGELIWNRNNGDTIYIKHGIYEYSDDSILAINIDGEVDMISVSDGTVKEHTPLLENDESIEYQVIQTALSKDKTKLAFFTKEQFSSNYFINEYDLKTKELVTRDWEYDGSDDMLYCNDSLLVAGIDGGSDSSSWFYDMNYVTLEHTKIYCLASGTLDEKWTYDFTNNDVLIRSGFLPLGTDKVAYYQGDMGRIWDLATGELLEEHNLNDPIVNISDNDRDGEPLYITRGGTSANPSFDGVTLMHRFVADLTDARVKQGVYVVQNQAKEIIFYGTNVYDESWTALEEVPLFNPAGDSSCMNEDCFVILTADGDGTRVLAMDPGEKKYLGEFSISSDVPPGDYKVLGILNNKVYISQCTSHKFALLTLDLNSKELSEEVINEDYSNYNAICSMKGDKLAYYDTFEYSESMVIIKNLTDGSEEKYSFPYSRIMEIELFDDAGLVYLSGGNEIILDLKSGEFLDSELPDNWGETTSVAADETGDLIVLTDAEKIRVLGRNGEHRYDISCENVYPVSLGIHSMADGKKVLFVPYNNGRLVRYDLENGDVIGTSKLSTYPSKLYDASFSFDDDEHLLYIKTGDILDVVETDTYVELACIEGCYGYHKASDTFWTYSYKESAKECSLGYFKRYSVEELIEKTKEHLCGTEMTKEQKEVYGIN